jgi:hypothetical protein
MNQALISLSRAKNIINHDKNSIDMNELNEVVKSEVISLLRDYFIIDDDTIISDVKVRNDNKYEFGLYFKAERIIFKGQQK